MTAKDFTPRNRSRPQQRGSQGGKPARNRDFLGRNYWAEKLENAKTAYNRALETVQTVGVQALAIARKTYEKATEKFKEAKSRVEEHVEALKALYVLYYEFVTPYTAK